MLLRELLVGIGFEVDDKGLESVSDKIGKFKGFVTKIGAVVTGATAAIAGMAYATGGMATELFNTSQGLSMTTQELQKLQFAGQSAGISADEVSSSLQSINDKIIGVVQGNASAIQSFGRFGVTVYKSNGQLKTAGDLTLELADKFSKLKAGSIKTGKAVELFGGAGSKMIRFLDKGSASIKRSGKEFEDFGGVLTDAEIMMGVKFNSSVMKTTALLKSLYVSVSVQLLPIVKKAIEGFQKWMLENKEFIKSGIKEFLKALADTVMFVGKAIGSTITFLGKFNTEGETTNGMLNGMIVLVKVAAGILATMFAASVLSSVTAIASLIGSLIGLAPAIWTIVAGFFQWAVAAGAAWLATLGPIGVVIAAIVAVGVAIAGIVYALKKFGETKVWKDFKKSAKEALREVMNYIVTGFTGAMSAITDWGIDKLKSVVDWAMSIYNKFKPSEKAKTAAVKITKSLKKGSTKRGYMGGSGFGIGQFKAPSSNSKTEINVKVNATTGASAKQIGVETANALKGEMEKQNFNAGVATQSNVEY